MQQIDLLIHAGWVIPVEPAGLVLEAHSIAVHNGRIEAVLPRTRAEAEYQAAEVRDLTRHALVPGFVNTHTHAAMSLMRGLADDLPLMTWLQEHIWPTEGRWVSEEFVHDGTQLALAEMIRGGTTCFNDMYFFPDITARAALHAGLRAMIGLIVIDFPTVWAQDADEYLAKGLALRDEFRSEPLLRTAFAPHAPYTVSDGPLERIRVLSAELGIPIHMHVHETADEVRRAVAEQGRRPLARLDALGLLSPDFLAVHMTQLEEGEIRLVAERGVRVLHCPESNLKLASGICPVQALLREGVTVALGTDGAASNNDLDMIAEMRTAALLAKVRAGDAAALPAHAALRMATLSGAEALGLQDEIGSIERGKSADLCAIDLSRLETQPVFDPVSQIVYAACREQVSDVWVAGRCLLRERRLTTLDEEALRERAMIWRDRISMQTGD